MAVIDQDNFSNISWHSDQAGEPSSSSSGAAALGLPGSGISDSMGGGMEQQGQQQQEPEPNYDRLDAGGLGGEVLECTVSSPLTENEGGSNPFTSYLVTTNSTFPSFQKPTVSVRRRFTDFLFLYNTLCKDYPACAVPPIPEKQRMMRVTGDRFGAEFTNRRANSLQRFLTRCALHPLLRRSAILHTFLESGEWNAVMRSRTSRATSGGAGSGQGAGGAGGSGGDGSSGGGGVFDAFADSLINAFTKMNRMDRRFVEVREKSDKLDEDLGHVEKVVVRVARREADLEADMRDLADPFRRLMALEPGVEPAVRGFAASVEDASGGLRRLREHTDQDYLGSLRDMVAYSGSLKNLLRAREQKQLDYEQLTEYLNKSTAERDALTGSGGYGGVGGGGYGGSVTGSAGGFIRSKIEDVRGVDHEQSRRERMRKLELRIDELTAEVERARRTSEMFDEEVVREVGDFERIKRVEFKRQLGALADAHIAFYDNVEDVWTRYVREMEGELGSGGGGGGSGEIS